MWTTAGWGRGRRLRCLAWITISPLEWTAAVYVAVLAKKWMHFSAWAARRARSDTLATKLAPENRGLPMTRSSCDMAKRARRENPQRRIAYVALAVLGLAPGLLHAAAPFTAEAMWQLKRLADPAISPDGRLAVVPVTHYDVDKNKGETDLWLVPTKPGKARQLTSDAASDTSPVWSPDGEQIAFVSRRGEDKQPQVYVIAVNGGEAHRVTNVPTGVLA